MGIHREFSHRVKSLSMSTFREEEMEVMRRGGERVGEGEIFGLVGFQAIQVLFIF